MGPLEDAGLWVAQLTYTDTLRMLGLRVEEIVMGVLTLFGVIVGLAYVVVSFRLASVMERAKSR